MGEEVMAALTDLRNQGVGLSETEATSVFEFCQRKADRCSITDKRHFLRLFQDELKNYVIRRSINAITMIRHMERALQEV